MVCAMQEAHCLGEAGFFPGRRDGWRDVVAVVYLFLSEHAKPTPPCISAPCARGEVDSNGLNSEEKAESTIGRKIKIIKTNLQLFPEKSIS